MSLTENTNGFTMPVAPMMGSNGGFGNGFGDGAWWLIVLLLFAGWGNNGWNNGGGNGGVNGLYPWMTQQQAITNGFDQAAISANLAGIQSSITNGFSNAEVAACNRAMTDMQAAHAAQIANMQQSFANATALDSRLDAMTLNQQNCCCENRAAVADLKYQIATEACADRTVVNDALRDVITNQTANTQTIVDAVRSINDKLCDQELQAERRENENLRTQLNMQNLAASQAAQTAALIADNNAQTQQLIQRVAPYPIPAFQVSNPYGCNGYGFNYGVA